MRNVLKFLGLEKSTAENSRCPSVLSSRISSWLLVLMLFFFVHELKINSANSELAEAVRKYLSLYGTSQTHKDMQMVSNMRKGHTSRVIRFPLACLPG